MRIWQLRTSDEATLSTVLPAEPTKDERPKPWLLHTLPVNTLNFCAFSVCNVHAVNNERRLGQPGSKHSPVSSSTSNEPILIAVPARDDRKIEVYQFPEEKLSFIVPRPQSADTGA